MQFAITDPAAVAFAGRFYTALSHGLPVDLAVGDARKTLYQRGAEWATPVVHLRGDGVVFEHASAALAAETGKPPPPGPARRRSRPPILVAGLVGLVAAGAAAAWWAISPGDDDTDDNTGEDTVVDTSPISLPAIELGTTALVTRACAGGGQIEFTAGAVELADGMMSTQFAASSAGLESDMNFDPIRVVDSQGRPYREVNARGLNGGFSLGQDEYGGPTEQADLVSVNHDDRAHPGAEGIVLVVEGDCTNDPIHLGLAIPSG
jgi:hypothetical protein